MQAHARRRRRLHPQHGDARPPRRPGARDERSRARPRRRRQGHRPHRDRRRRPGRSRHRPHRRRLDRDARAGRRRRGAGAQGRHHGDRRHLRRQQGGPRGSRSDRRVDRGDAVAAGVRPGAWRPPIVKTEATTGKGVPELLEAIERFRAHTAATQGEPPARARRVARARAAGAALRPARRAPGARGRGVRRDAGPDRGARDRSVHRGGSDRHVGALRTRPTERSSGEADGRHEGTIDHIGIAVVQPRATRSRSTATRSASRSKRPRRSRRSACARTSSRPARPRIELLEATADDSPIAKYVAKRGPGLHHITLRVDDIAAALAQLKARGVRLIDEAPRPGAHGSLVAFIHPSSAHGVLVELKQAVQQSESRDRPFGDLELDAAPRRLLPPRRRRDVRRRAEAAVGAPRAGRRAQPDPARRCGRCSCAASRR